MKPKNGLSRFDLQKQADANNRRYNIAMRMAEKTGFEEQVNAQFKDWEMEPAKEPIVTYRNQTAPTTKPERPRALKIAYSREARKLVVKFRDGTWWEYNDIPLRMWVGLKASDSTGKYLKYSGLDDHDDMGPFDPSEMPPEIRVIFNS
jgi:hypothetical protein